MHSWKASPPSKESPLTGDDEADPVLRTHWCKCGPINATNCLDTKWVPDKVQCVCCNEAVFLAAVEL